MEALRRTFFQDWRRIKPNNEWARLLAKLFRDSNLGLTSHFLVSPLSSPEYISLHRRASYYQGILLAYPLSTETHSSSLIRKMFRVTARGRVLRDHKKQPRNSFRFPCRFYTLIALHLDIYVSIVGSEKYPPQMKL